MDERNKAEVVFEKIAGPRWDKVKSFTRNFFGRNLSGRERKMNYLRNSIRGGVFSPTKTMTTPRIKKLNNDYVHSKFREMQNTWNVRRVK